MKSTRVLAVALLGIAGLLTACGNDHSTATGQVIDITMTDNAYQPAQLSVPSGEPVTLRFVNEGAVRHEAVVGDEARQNAHGGAMSASTMDDDMGDDMDMNHDGGTGHAGASADNDFVTVEPGQTGSITTMFGESDSLMIGCHEPGHWEAGMKATIDVR